MIGAIPQWFNRALSSQPRTGFIPVSGCPIHYRYWEGASEKSLFLIHGSGAHSHWWDFIAPYFVPEFSVVALDLSGMGASGHRSGYSTETYAEEIMAIGDHLKMPRPWTLVGHSFGGYVALRTACQRPEGIDKVVLLDSPIRPPDYDWQQGPSSPIRKKKVYATREEILSRFRLMPAQPCENQYLLDYIAENSIARTEEGWSWKFDEKLFQHMSIGNLSEDLAAIEGHIAVVYGEQSSIFTEDVIQYMKQVLGRPAPFTAIPEAYHHLILDQPLACVTALRLLFDTWEIFSRTR